MVPGECQAQGLQPGYRLLWGFPGMGMQSFPALMLSGAPNGVVYFRVAG